MSRAGRAIEMAAVTDRGRLRERNEDAVAVDQAIGMAAVADGMGGLQHGDRASRQALAAVCRISQRAAAAWDAAARRHALSSANSRIRELGQSAGVAMGTTAVVLAMEGDRCRIAHVGDSRAYRFRGGELCPADPDHSLVQEMVDRGVHDRGRRTGIQPPPHRHPGAGLEPRSGGQPRTRAGSRRPAVAVQDGLWEMLEDDQSPRCSPAAARPTGTGAVPAALVNAANGAGGLDNVSVVLARY